MQASTKMAFREVMVLFGLILLVMLFIFGAHRILFGERAMSLTKEIAIRIEDIPIEYLDGVGVGDRVLDRTRRTILGDVAQVLTEPHTYERAVDGESVRVEKKGYCDATFRILIDLDNRRNLDKGVFYIGSGITISTHSFSGDGKIISLSRVEGAE